MQVQEALTLMVHLRQHQYHHLEVLQDRSQAQIHIAAHLLVYHLEAAAHMDLLLLQLHHHLRMEAHLPQARALIAVRQAASHLEVVAHMDPLLQLLLPGLHMEAPQYQVAAPFHLVVVALMDLPPL